jgi:hypothetical protein
MAGAGTFLLLLVHLRNSSNQLLPAEPGIAEAISRSSSLDPPTFARRRDLLSTRPARISGIFPARISGTGISRPKFLRAIAGKPQKKLTAMAVG